MVRFKREKSLNSERSVETLTPVAIFGDGVSTYLGTGKSELMSIYRKLNPYWETTGGGTSPTAGA